MTVSKPKKVLIVDDDPTVAELLSARLKLRGHEAQMALSAAEGLKANAASHPQILLLDIRLQEGEKAGMHLLQELLMENPSARAVMLTAAPLVQDAVQSIQMGAADYLEKPIDFEKLFQLVEREF
jgi:DNA-binding NtrC family response regulator